MGTKNSVALLSTINGVTTTYYLSGGTSRTPYSGSGTPWTVESTSPYDLSNNDVTGDRWVPTPAEPQMIYSGSLPFRFGRTPIYQGYDIVTESVGVQLRATTKSNAIALLRQLRAILNSAHYSMPCVLAVQGGTNTGYTEIYRAHVPEHFEYINEPDGFFRITVTWDRAPFFGRIDSGEVLINSATIQNRGTSSPDNVEAYGTGAGDLIYEGQPLNITWLPIQAATYSKLYIASIHSRAYSTTGAGALSTSSTTGADVTLAQFDATAALTRKALKARILIHATCAANAQYRVLVYFGSTNKQLVYSSPWIQTTATISTLADAGTFSLASVRPSLNLSQPLFTVVLRYRSTNGASATTTLTSSQYLLYYDYAVVNASGGVTLSNSDTYLIDQFPEQTGFPCLPYYPPRVLVIPTTDVVASVDYRGTLPRYWHGASLWMAWLSSGAYTTTQTASVSVRHGPLYRTIRGNG